ncbi:MAG: hypothetical protein JWR09_102 [Mucilaginibacter sp.]|nr:hypothetical protein [Mucilaginibacter sp.]
MEGSKLAELLEKYINGNCTEAEIALVKEWYHSFEQEHDHISGISLFEENKLKERIYNHILHNTGETEEEEEELPLRRSNWLVSRWPAIASAAAIIVAIGALVLYQHNQIRTMQMAADDISQQQMVSITNNSDQIYKAKLPDNSFVWLNPRSQLTFPKVFGSKSRAVSISGECFFEVTKNPKCPFIINSRSIITKVWGTSFFVRDNDQSNTAEVSVLTGKVSVSIKTAHNSDQPSLKLEKGEVMLYPHQKAIYLIDQHILKPETVENDATLQIWKRVNLFFDNKPLGEIIPVLNSTFHVHIKVRSEKLNHYILNADMSGFNLPDVLQALKKSLNVNYELGDYETDIELE